MTTSDTNPKVDAFVGRQTQWQGEIEQLRAIVLDCGLTEEVKWGKPCYTSGGKNVVLILPLKEHLSLLVFKGALLDDPADILVQPTGASQSQRQIRFSSVREIAELEPTLKSYIQAAVEAEQAGLKVDFKQKRELVIPEELQDKLADDRALKTAFESLTPGRQRAYVLHFSAPKQSKTRTSRIEKCTPRILDGKGLND